MKKDNIIFYQKREIYYFRSANATRNFHKIKWNYWKSGISAAKFIWNEKSQQLDGNSREIRFAKNPRDLEKPMPGVFQKMNPQVNDDRESDSDNEKNENVNQTKRIENTIG